MDLTSLLGRAVVIHAEWQTVLPQDLVTGVLTLRRAFQAKGRRARDWEQLLQIDLTSVRELSEFRQGLGPRSVCVAMVTQAIEVLTASSNGPLLTGTVFNDGPAVGLLEADTWARPAQPISDLPNEADNDGDLETIDRGGPATENDAGNALIPNIQSRIAAADYSTFGEKLGLSHRDQLLPDDLRLVTRRIVQLLDDSNPTHSAYSLLALVSLVTGCPDEVALTLCFYPHQSIWIDVERQAWCWSFDAYRGHDDAPGQPRDTIYCPLPLVVARKLQSWRLQSECEQATLRDVILAGQKTGNFNIGEFRAWLRTCGDSAHPAYRGRFARSLTGVVLQITGSDMSAAMLTGRFQAAAPASLYYFGPSTELMWSRINATYEWLGLGEASPSAAPYQRLACTKVLQDTLCTAGWNEFVKGMDMARTATRSTPPESRRLHANSWMRLIALAFVIQTAHRGTRLDRLTFGALYADHDMGVIHDKDDAHGERAQPRLIPWTSTVRRLLCAALECHQLLSATNDQLLASTAVDASVFVQWTDQSGEIEPIRTGDLAPVATEFFGSEVNFGRAQWVTGLDRDGVDRWLIRSLTGHTRDVTRTSGAYFDVPPSVACVRLRAAMERTGETMFGQAKPVAATVTWAPADLQPQLTDTAPAQPGAKVPDPRTILPPITARTLIGWKIASRLRTALTRGSVVAPIPALAALHLLFIDLVPEAELALEAILHSPRRSHSVGQRQGLLWHRPHQLNATWLPVQASTWQLLTMAQKTGQLVRADLLRDVCASALAEVSDVRWPENDDVERWNWLAACAANFRRLSLPPSLTAVSATQVAAPALSRHSLYRLAGQMPEPQLATPRLPRLLDNPLSTKDEGLEALSRTLHKYANSEQRLGERRKRAVNCRREIVEAAVRWTPFARFLRDWIAEELTRTRDGFPGSYQLSSLSTYLATTLLAKTRVQTLDDPDEWSADDWTQYIDWTDKLCRGSASGDGGVPTERARHALLALIRSLRRRQIDVPRAALERLHEAPENTTAGDSSSAVLIMPRDIRRAAELARHWLADSPVDALMVEIRATISLEFPARSADLSSLGWDCLTQSDGLVIHRQGYNHHKTKNAIRIHKLSQACAKSIRELRMDLSRYTPARDLLLRLDGTDAAGRRDAQNAELWSTALKAATNDRRARPHSTRAAALQEIAWPCWQDQAATWLTTPIGPHQTGIWIDTLQSEWNRVAKATVAAGHGDLRSALGNYLAAWPLVHAMSIEALLRPLHIEPGLLRQLNVDPASLRKARSRRAARGTPQSSGLFDCWAWLQKNLINSAASGIAPSPRTDTTPQVDAVARRVAGKALLDTETQAPPRLDDVTFMASIRYIAVRILGQSPQAGIESTRVSLSLARTLEPLLPDGDAASELTRRARTSAQERAQKANLRMALSDIGEQIFRWLAGLDESAFEFLRHCALRLDAPDVIFSKYVHWEPVTVTLPTGLALGVRRGAAHVSTDESQFCAVLRERLRLTIDPRMGCRPVVHLRPANEGNRVLTARLTSVLKAGVFAIHQLRQEGRHA